MHISGISIQTLQMDLDYWMNSRHDYQFPYQMCSVHQDLPVGVVVVSVVLVSVVVDDVSAAIRNSAHLVRGSIQEMNLCTCSQIH